MESPVAKYTWCLQGSITPRGKVNIPYVNYAVGRGNVGKVP